LAGEAWIYGDLLVTAGRVGEGKGGTGREGRGSKGREQEGRGTDCPHPFQNPKYATV